MYHYIRVNPVAGDRLGFSLSVTPDDFSRQMDYLRANGIHTVSMDDVMDSLETGRALPSRAVVLTFDDGYADFATAAVPIMVAHGFTGTTYAVPGFLGRPNYMSVAQLKHAASLHMVIAAHTIHHVDLPRLSEADAWAEIAGSRQQLQQLTGQPVNDFAYPYGHVATVDAGLVHRAGFRDAVTTMPGSVHTLAQRYTMTRVRVSGGESLEQFAASLALAPRPSLPPSHSAPPSAASTTPTAAPRASPLAGPPAAATTAPSIRDKGDELRTHWVRGSPMRSF